MVKKIEAYTDQASPHKTRKIDRDSVLRREALRRKEAFLKMVDYAASVTSPDAQPDLSQAAQVSKLASDLADAYLPLQSRLRRARFLTLAEHRLADYYAQHSRISAKTLAVHDGLRKAQHVLRCLCAGDDVPERYISADRTLLNVIFEDIQFPSDFYLTSDKE